MPIVAKFIVENTFNLTRRGLVLVGRIVEGDISSVNYIHIGPDNQFRIIGIDYPRQQYPTLQLGLFIGNVTISQGDLNKMIGQTYTITDQ